MEKAGTASKPASFNPRKKEPTLLEIPSLLLLNDTPGQELLSDTIRATNTTVTQNEETNASNKDAMDTTGDEEEEAVDWSAIIPEETLLKVFKELSARDTLRICLASRRWGELWQDKHLWKHFHLRDLGGSPLPPLLPQAWKRSFVDAVNGLRSFKTEEGRFSFAVRKGLVTLVDRMLQRPELLYKTRKDNLKSEYCWKSKEYEQRIGSCPCFSSSGTRTTMPLQRI